MPCHTQASTLVRMLVGVFLAFPPTGRALEFTAYIMAERAGCSHAAQERLGIAARQLQLTLAGAACGLLTAFPAYIVVAAWLMAVVISIWMEVRHVREGLGGSTSELLGVLNGGVVLAFAVAAQVSRVVNECH